MEIILKKDVEKLGFNNEIVTVKWIGSDKVSRFKSVGVVEGNNSLIKFNLGDNELAKSIYEKNANETILKFETNYKSQSNSINNIFYMATQSYVL